MSSPLSHLPFGIGLEELPSQQRQSPDLYAPERREFVQGASLTCSVLLLSMFYQHREVGTRQTPFHRILEVSLCNGEILSTSLRQFSNHGMISSAGSLPEIFLKDTNPRSKALKV